MHKNVLNVNQLVDFMIQIILNVYVKMVILKQMKKCVNVIIILINSM